VSVAKPADSEDQDAAAAIISESSKSLLPVEARCRQFRPAYQQPQKLKKSGYFVSMSFSSKIQEFQEVLEVVRLRLL